MCEKNHQLLQNYIIMNIVDFNNGGAYLLFKYNNLQKKPFER